MEKDTVRVSKTCNQQPPSQKKEVLHDAQCFNAYTSCANRLSQRSLLPIILFAFFLCLHPKLTKKIEIK